MVYRSNLRLDTLPPTTCIGSKKSLPLPLLPTINQYLVCWAPCPSSTRHHTKKASRSIESFYRQPIYIFKPSKEMFLPFNRRQLCSVYKLSPQIVKVGIQYHREVENIIPRTRSYTMQKDKTTTTNRWGRMEDTIKMGVILLMPSNWHLLACHVCNILNIYIKVAGGSNTCTSISEKWQSYWKLLPRNFSGKNRRVAEQCETSSPSDPSRSIHRIITY